MKFTINTFVIVERPLGNIKKIYLKVGNYPNGCLEFTIIFREGRSLVSCNYYTEFGFNTETGGCLAVGYLYDKDASDKYIKKGWKLS